MHQLAIIMAAKGPKNSSEMETLQGVDRVEQITILMAEVSPPTLPDMAAVAAGALALPRSYVKRLGVHAAADGLINPETPRIPYLVVGMGGARKSAPASVCCLARTK